MRKFMTAAVAAFAFLSLSVGPALATMTPGPTSSAPTGAAGGDLSGTYPNPTVAKSTWIARQTINLNAASLPAPITGTAVLVGPADGITGRVQVDAFGTIGAFSCARYNGTGAALSAVLSGDQICGVNGYAYDSGGTLDGPIYSFRGYAAENITASANGSRAAIATTGLGSLTLTDRLIVGPAGQVQLTGYGAGVLGTDGSGNVTASTTPSVDSLALAGSSAPTNGIYLPSANVVGVSASSSNRAQISSTELRLRDTMALSWASSSISTPDVFEVRDAANTLALRNGVNAQCLRVYNTWTDASNYERAGLCWSGNVFSITPEAAGTGTIRTVTILGSAFRNGGTASGSFSTNVATSFATSRIASFGSSGLTATSGVQYGVVIDPTINQTSTAGYTALNVNVTETGLGGGSNLLMDLGVGGGSYVSKFKVDNVGGVTAAGSITIANSGVVLFSGRGRISSPVAGQIQLGAADAAAPVAQTLSAQSVVTGTSNTAGANLTITGSQGTGTGTGGSIIFQTAPAGSTGSTPNALSTVLTLSAAGSGVFTGPLSASSGTFSSTINANGGSGVIVGGNSGSFQLAPITASATAPTLRPNRTSAFAGIGADAAGDVSIIAENTGAGVEAARVTGTTITATLPLITAPKTVATLAACTAGLDGARSFVTDALAPTFGSAVAGSGAVHIPVYCDGSGTPAWKVG